MDIRLLGLDNPFLHAIHNLIDPDDTEANKSVSAPTRTYVRDARAMAATPADVKEYPNSYVFVIDMPGLKSGDIKVQIEDDNVLLISGERKREEEKEGAKFIRMERRVGKFMRKFALPENANTDKITAVCHDGVLTVTVEKLPPPEPKKPKTIERENRVKNLLHGYNWSSGEMTDGGGSFVAAVAIELNISSKLPFLRLPVRENTSRRRVTPYLKAVCSQPPKFKQFDGKDNPKQHVAHFVETSNDVGTHRDQLVKQFVRSLKDNAFDWYIDLGADSIDDWDQLVKQFLERFYNTRRTV
ncbi:hypothetical protein RD792_013206 [Penstemon davidsonii]|uniref:SHSP domain-containing protein n=1 Tax=Penstemon davidsonii TaxID=160366 RepID=A0ABR0CUB5_9LAMI|nr:hypothetical protein RD792_013206 [Penstemon davidsonii]